MKFTKFIQDRTLLISSSFATLGILISFETMFFLSLERSIPIYCLGFHLALLPVFLSIAEILRQRHEISILQDLDEIAGDKRLLSSLVPSPSFAIITVASAFRYGHPIMKHWKYMRIILEYYYYYEQVWMVFTRFAACFPDNPWLLDWASVQTHVIFPNVTDVYVLNAQVYHCCQYRSAMLTPKLEAKCNEIVNNTIFTTMCLKGHWETVRKGKLSDISTSNIQTQIVVSRNDDKARTLVNMYPNNPYSRFAYVQYLESTFTNPEVLIDVREKYQMMISGQISTIDPYKENAHKLFDKDLVGIFPSRFKQKIDPNVGQAEQTVENADNIDTGSMQEEISELDVLIDAIESISLPSFKVVQVIVVFITITLVTSIILLCVLTYILDTRECYEQFTLIKSKVEMALHISYSFLVSAKKLAALTLNDIAPDEVFYECDQLITSEYSLEDQIAFSVVTVGSRSYVIFQDLYRQKSTDLIFYVETLLTIMKSVNKFETFDEVQHFYLSSASSYTSYYIAIIETIYLFCEQQLDYYRAHVKLWRNILISIVIAFSAMSLGVYGGISIFVYIRFRSILRAISHAFLMIPLSSVIMAEQKLEQNKKHLQANFPKEEYYEMLLNEKVNFTLFHNKNVKLIKPVFYYILCMLIIAVCIPLITVTISFQQQNMFSRYLQTLSALFFKPFLTVNMGTTTSLLYHLHFLDAGISSIYEKGTLLSHARHTVEIIERDLNKMMFGNKTLSVESQHTNLTNNFFHSTHNISHSDWKDQHDFFTNLPLFGQTLSMIGQISNLLSGLASDNRLREHNLFSTGNIFALSHFTISHLFNQYIYPYLTAEHVTAKIDSSFNIDLTAMLSASIPLFAFIIIAFFSSMCFINPIVSIVKGMLYQMLSIVPRSVVGIPAISDLLLGHYHFSSSEYGKLSKGYFNNLAKSLSANPIIVTNKSYIVIEKHGLRGTNITVNKNKSLKQLIPDTHLWIKIDECLNGKSSTDILETVQINDKFYDVNVIARSKNSYIESTINSTKGILLFIFIFTNVTERELKRIELENATDELMKLLPSLVPTHLINDVIIEDPTTQGIRLTTTSILTFGLADLDKTSSSLSSEYLVKFHRRIEEEIIEILKTKYKTLDRVNNLSTKIIVASGICPLENGQKHNPGRNARDVVRFAIECQKVVQNVNKELKTNITGKTVIVSGGPTNAILFTDFPPHFDVFGPIVKEMEEIFPSTPSHSIIIQKSTSSLIFGADFNIKEAHIDIPHFKNHDQLYFVLF